MLALGLTVQPAHGRFVQQTSAQTLEAAAPLAPGDLDPSFGEDGLVTTDMNRNSEGDALVLQPDGKIVLAGRVVSGMGTGELSAKYDFALIRYNSGGELDETFGADGRVSTDFGDTDDIAYCSSPAGRRQDHRGRKLVPSWTLRQSICLRDRPVSRGREAGQFIRGQKGKRRNLVEWRLQCGRLAARRKDRRGRGLSNELIQNKWGIGLLRFNSDGSLDDT